MEKILKELKEKVNSRSNLSALRQQIKEENKYNQLKNSMEEYRDVFIEYLKDEDAKTRKNAALLLGDLACQESVEDLLAAYETEATLFVKASYLQALEQLDVSDKLSVLKNRLEELLKTEVEEDNKKHVGEEIRALRKIMILHEGIKHHTADIKGKKVSVILLTNRTQKETVRRMVDCGQAKIHPLGVWVDTDNLPALMKIRTFRDMVFPLKMEGFISGDPVEAAKQIWESDVLGLLDSLHKEKGEYYFRIECKGAMELDERSGFTKKLASALEELSQGQLINSTSDYEVELRLIANKDGGFFPALRLSTIKKRRFTYRKNVIATSIHPSTAALIMEIAKDYLKEDAQIIDPFCGVGTMLIERHKKVPARELYGVDIFGDAIKYARENTEAAGIRINYINRDFRDFKHEYLFNEIVTNMPVRGKKTKQEMDSFYGEFFEKAKTILTKDAVVVMYTNEIGFVKKQLRLHKEFELAQETCMQPKTEFYLLIMKYKG